MSDLSRSRVLVTGESGPGNGCQRPDGGQHRNSSQHRSSSQHRNGGEGPRLVRVDDITSGVRTGRHSGHNGPLIHGARESVTVNDVLAAARVAAYAELSAQCIPPEPGEMPAVIVDLSAASALGYRPAHDLMAGIATVWPEFAETTM